MCTDYENAKKFRREKIYDPSTNKSYNYNDNWQRETRPNYNNYNNNYNNYQKSNNNNFNTRRYYDNDNSRYNTNYKRDNNRYYDELTTLRMSHQHLTLNVTIKNPKGNHEIQKHQRQHQEIDLLHQNQKHHIIMLKRIMRNST